MNQISISIIISLKYCYYERNQTLKVRSNTSQRDYQEKKKLGKVKATLVLLLMTNLKEFNLKALKNYTVD